MEVLVSSALLALILTAVFSSFSNFTFNSKKLENKIILGRHISSLKRLIEKDFRSVIFLAAYTQSQPTKTVRYISGIQGDNKLIGQINADQVFMHVNRNLISYNEITKQNNPLVHEVGYFVAIKDDETFELYRREQYYINTRFNSYIGLLSKENILPENNARVALLTDNIIDFDVKYLDSNNTWLEQWNSISSKNKWDKENPHLRSRIPRSVEVTLALKKDGTVVKDSFQINLRPKLTENVFWGEF